MVKAKSPFVSGPMCERFVWKFAVQTLLALELHSWANFSCEIKFPRATYHTIVPLTEEH